MGKKKKSTALAVKGSPERTLVKLYCPICRRDWQAMSTRPELFRYDNEQMCDDCAALVGFD